MHADNEIRNNGILDQTFFGSLIFLPLVSLFWQESLWVIKFNWIVYPFFLAGVAVFVFISKQVTIRVTWFGLVFLVYGMIFITQKGDIESLGRIAISVIPFLFLPNFDKSSSFTRKNFLLLYTAFFVPALYVTYLQYTGQSPYYEFDYVNGERVGRLSGGYSKPTNFVAFLAPLYVFGIYLVVVKKRKLEGWLMTGSLLLLAYLVGHRTSFVAFGIMATAVFAGRYINTAIYHYYKYYGHFIVGIVSFVAFYILKAKFGLLDYIRGRVPMWQAHAEAFFESDFASVLFGKQRVKLGDEHLTNVLISSIDEAHNNSFRTIVLFGIVGFYLYAAFMRWVVLSSYDRHEDSGRKLVISCTLIFFILYSITNEPFYYASVAWPILAWLFLLRKE
jgi:hypothetical protein